MVLFNKCCFCIPLKTGCFILGYLQLVGALIGLVYAGIALGAGKTFSLHSDPHDVQLANFFMACGLVLLVVYLVVFCISFIALVGLHNSKPSLIKAYLIVSVIAVVVNLIAFAAQFYYSSHDKQRGTIIDDIVYLAFDIYVLLVFKSYYTVLKEEQLTSYMRVQKM